MSDQGIETCRFGFEVRKEVKEPETKFKKVKQSYGNLPFLFLKP